VKRSSDTLVVPAERADQPRQPGPVRRFVERAGVRSPRLLLETSGSLTGAMVVTSALGAAFWWAAARLFTPHAVGLAAGWVSAMTLLGAIAVLGTGSLLLRELPRRPGEERELIGTALAVVLVAGAIVAVGFALIVPASDPQQRFLSESLGALVLFAVGVMLTAAATVIDHALLGLLRAPVQLLRNVVFAVSKLILLPAVLILSTADAAAGIYGVWVLGAVISLAAAAAIQRHVFPIRVSRRLVAILGRSALLHFALNTALVLPTLLMPVLVALTATPVVAAQFYVAWMLASVSFYAPVAFAQSLYAIGGRHVNDLWAHARTTAALSLGCGALAFVGAVILAGPVLSLFGPTYHEAAGAAAVMTAIAMPLSVKDHFQVISRIRGRPGFAAAICGVGGAIEVASGGIGLFLAGIEGLAIGWLAAVTLEAVVLAPITYRAARENVAA
jgi:O-antigen/teichoic acid export membrane protein